MQKKRVVAIALAMSVWPSSSFAQAPQNGTLTHTEVNVQPKTTRQVLQELGIGLDPASLKVALKSQDPRIRGLAASMLASDRITNAIPDIESALATETDNGAKIRITGSLASLQPKDDSNIALQTCRNSALDRRQIIGAAQAAILFVPDGAASACVPNLLMFLKDSNDPRNQIAALSQLTSFPFFSKLPEPTRTEVRSIEVAFLSGSDHSKKFAALQGLSLDQSKEARDALAKAAETEPDAGIRHLMEDVVKKKDTQLAGEK